MALSLSPFIAAKTIYCKIFIAIPENPCPVERDTIISKGKWAPKPKKLPEHKALIKPNNIIKRQVKNLFIKESIAKSIVNNGIIIRKAMEPIIPIINCKSKG